MSIFGQDILDIFLLSALADIVGHPDKCPQKNGFPKSRNSVASGIHAIGSAQFLPTSEEVGLNQGTAHRFFLAFAVFHSNFLVPTTCFISHH
jgi:hypothetical protein